MKILGILTTVKDKAHVEAAINTVKRLNELVEIMSHLPDEPSTEKVVKVEDGYIKVPLDWHDEEGPYVFPDLAFSISRLLSIVFFKLGNYSKALDMAHADQEMYTHIHLAWCIKSGNPIAEKLVGQILLAHNQCTVHHYGNYTLKDSYSALKTRYINAMAGASQDELNIFTGKHYINLLLDHGEFAEAERLIYDLLPRCTTEESKNALSLQLATALMHQLEMPFDQEQLTLIQGLFQKSIHFYEGRHMSTNAGLALLEAAKVAHFQKAYPTSKAYLNSAIVYFKEENITELLGEACVQKATLYYAWSKDGSPQYYKPAINTFQDALKVFKKNSHPKMFADIQHHMALLYSEMPASTEEKPMWAAFAASAFKEALAFYNKEDSPYEYAMVCHNFATALMHFPEGKLNNNLEKASDLFDEALAIRKHDTFPTERASTLLNQLELFWMMHNENEREEAKRLEKMQSKIEEVKRLAPDEGMLDKVAFHEKELDALKRLL